ncbi:MAG: hypothetical protein IPO91_33320 [Chloroflexi bacterium]|nr:hypothetical protein [Chloroflexota bacterium]
MASEPLKIGLFVGREWSWPPAFLDEVNRRTAETGVVAEYVRIGGTMINDPVDYRVIVDRISHEVPYYRLFLKHAALQGVKVVNDPFMWTADDKFFGAALAERVGIAQPRTVALPNKEYVPGIVHNESLRNLRYPIEWEGLVNAVGGFPCILKDAHGGGWKEVYVIKDMDDLWDKYNQSGLLSMILQEYIKWDDYARCMGLGQSDVRVMRYNPNARYYSPEHGFSQDLYERLYNDTLTICRTFGYDMNTCEFAIKDGVPYAIDFMNPAPDMDVNSLGRGHFEWMVVHMADMTIRLARSNEGTRDRYTWGELVKARSEKAV